TWARFSAVFCRRTALPLLSPARYWSFDCGPAPIQPKKSQMKATTTATRMPGTKNSWRMNPGLGGVTGGREFGDGAPLLRKPASSDECMEFSSIENNKPGLGEEAGFLAYFGYFGNVDVGRVSSRNPACKESEDAMLFTPDEFEMRIKEQPFRALRI